jgi:O-methyltransferase involved in polyketide biosynthesis
MKGHTPIPFAKEASRLLEKHSIASMKENLDEQFYYWMRVFHFEARYASINVLLEDIRPQNILELSSGYSFRGLDYCINHHAHYIDTDLPQVVDLKINLEKELIGDDSIFKGKLETLPLNALDEQSFDEIVARFNNSPLTIVNEGLLMYLNTGEKKKLCHIIRKHLVQKGGYWITADIYIRTPESNVRNLKMSKEEEEFFTKHHIDENKFDSEIAAEEFFKSEGLVIDKVSHVDVTALSSFQKLLQYVPEGYEKKPMPKIQNTWRLKVIQ